MFGEESFRFGRAWDPWRELMRLQDEVNRVFSAPRAWQATGTPVVSVWTKDDGALLRAEVPGFESKDLDISVLGDSVTLSGRREPDAEAGDVTFHRREREFGQFSRTLQLPFRIESARVKAELRDGVLELELPRADADRPRRIAVKAD